MELIWTIIGFVFLIAGLLGSFLPVLPGPPISFIGLLLMYFLGAHSVSVELLLFYGGACAVLMLLDYLLPIWTSKKFGGTKSGQWGAAIGVLLGLFSGPWGIILGPFIGAYLGELLAGRKNKEAWRSAQGAFFGFLLGTGFKMMLVGAMLWTAIHI